MKLKKHQIPSEGNLEPRTGMSFYLNDIANQIIYGESGNGKSYSPFFVKHNLMGLSNEELKVRLELLSKDENSTEEDRNRAKSILLTNLFNKQNKK